MNRRSFMARVTAGFLGLLGLSGIAKAKPVEAGKCIDVSLGFMTRGEGEIEWMEARSYSVEEVTRIFALPKDSIFIDIRGFSD